MASKSLLLPMSRASSTFRTPDPLPFWNRLFFIDLSFPNTQLVIYLPSLLHHETESTGACCVSEKKYCNWGIAKLIDIQSNFAHEPAIWLVALTLELEIVIQASLTIVDLVFLLITGNTTIVSASGIFYIFIRHRF